MQTGCNKNADLFIIAILTLLTSTVFGQTSDWDDVSREELEMKIYPADSSASAVILFDKAEVDLNRNLEYVMERHVRIKILREEGYRWGQTEIIYNEEMDQEISRIRGHTFTLNENGNIDKHKLDGDSIFEEEMEGDFEKIKFTLPALEPGAVTEFKYRYLVGSPYLLPDWEFQKSIPVKWSEYIVKIPDWFFYNKMLMGTHPIHIQESNPFNDRMRYTIKQRSGFYTRQTDYQNAYIDVNGTENRWVMKDIPVVKELPYMTSVDDYKSKLWMQLTEVRFPRQVPKYFLKSWSDIAQELRDIDSFGGQLENRRTFEETVNQLTRGLQTPYERMQTIYKTFTESIVWNGTHDVLADEPIEEVWENKNGSSAEINLLLTQFLREAGLQADPVVISTREHGMVLEFSAMVNQFNHVISSVVIEDETYLLDATSGINSVNMLPIKDLNGYGLLVGSDKEAWAKLQSRIPTSRTVTMNATLTNEGDFDATVNIVSEGYEALKESRLLSKNGNSGYLNNLMEKHFAESAIDSFHIDDADASAEKLKYKVFLSDGVPVYSQRSANMLYFNPAIFLKVEHNPFTLPEREIPVDFPHTFEKNFVANFVIPNGYSIEEVPEPKILKMPDGSAELRRLTQVNGNWITVMSKLSIKKKTFSPEEYQYLRDFYSHVVDAHNEQIVLKNKEASNTTE